jgi:threonine dehydratase
VPARSGQGRRTSVASIPVAAKVELVGIEAIRAARAGLTGILRPTPVEEADTLSRMAGRPVLLKPEHRQRTGSFKIRGAYTHVAALPDDGARVVAASAGNHAQGVALAASLAGRRSSIFMPSGAPLPKVEATRAYGADVRLVGSTVDDCMLEARAAAESGGGHLVPPFDDPLVIAGQGTIGLEIADEAGPEIEAVVVPVGGGGLVAGIAAALASVRPGVRVIGVEAEGAAAMRASLAAGAPVRLDAVDTIADGIAVKTPSPLTLAHAEAYVDEVITVSDEEIGRALILLLERAKAVVEPAGVAGLAALLAGKVAGSGPVVVVLSGGNVDPLMLRKLIEHGLSAAGRFLRLRLIVDDHPGALASVTALLAELGLNVLDVEHHRVGVAVGIDQVELLVTLETRDPDHRIVAVDRLRAAGHTVEQIL